MCECVPCMYNAKNPKKQDVQNELFPEVREQAVAIRECVCAGVPRGLSLPGVEHLRLLLNIHP